MSEDVTVYEFNAIPVFEKWYSEDTSWGIFNFYTYDTIPNCSVYNDPFDDDFYQTGSEHNKKNMSSLVGKMQKLFIGSEYKVKATCEYNTKYSSWQYVPISIVAVEPKTYEAQKLFLDSLTSSTISNNILSEYPSIVNDVMNGKYEDLDYDKIKGLGKVSWTKIRQSIIDNYIVSDIITMLQPLGVTYGMIKTLIKEEPNPALLKEQLEENPYIMTKIKGLGFKRVDELSLKLNPNLLNSMHRLTAFVSYYLHEMGENDGHTWLTIDELKNQVSDNCMECVDSFDKLLESNSFLYKEEDKIGLKYYHDIEKNIFDILKEKNKTNNTRFDFDDEKINQCIKKTEDEQGFEFTTEQRQVIVKTLQNDVSVISGQAGAGKTSISRAILKIYKNNGFSISACALSAKAAQRITEATTFPASTIHRTLGAKGLNHFTYDVDNPIHADVVFVDEASMINAKLFYDLLCAISTKTRIVICGDNKQLPPIGYGNIFSDLLDYTEEFNSNKLTKSMRQALKSGILSDALEIRKGNNPISSPDLKIVHGELKDMIYMFRDNREQLQNIAIKTFLTSIETDGLDEVVIITPRRDKCVNSAFEINKIIQDKLLGDNVDKIDKGYITYKVGAKVMQTVNDYDRNVFNGEMGYITQIVKQGNKEYCIIEFNNNEQKKIITYSKSELDQIQLGYALTTHKCQGSGYKTVIGVIDNTHYALLDNCMLYTLITRAKSRCLLLAEPKAFIRCIKTNHNTSRKTWLKLFNKGENI